MFIGTAASRGDKSPGLAAAACCLPGSQWLSAVLAAAACPCAGGGPRCPKGESRAADDGGPAGSFCPYPPGGNGEPAGTRGGGGWCPPGSGERAADSWYPLVEGGLAPGGAKPALV